MALLAWLVVVADALPSISLLFFLALVVQWFLAWQVWDQLGPEGVLTFSHPDWCWRQSGVEEPIGQPDVRIDLGAHLLIAFRVAEQTDRIGPVTAEMRWFWLDSTANPGKWHAFRCAVYSTLPKPLPNRGGDPGT